MFESNYLSFLTNYSDTVSNKYKVVGYNSNNEINIYDIINGLRIISQTFSSDTLFLQEKEWGIRNCK